MEAMNANAGQAATGEGLGCYLYQVLGVSTARRNASRQVKRSITIGRSDAELYRFWHEPGNRNRIMGHLTEVTAASKERTHWRVWGPLGCSLEWDSLVVEDCPGEYLR